MRGTAASRKVVLSFGSKRKNQRKLPLFRRSGPATKGLHAPWIPKAEVAECAGYANAVLLFALNARALCSVLKFGCSPEPPQGAREAPLSKGAGRVSGLGDSDEPCVAARSRSTTRQLQRGGRPPSLAPLVHDDSRQSVGAGHARPATLLCPPSTGIHPLTPAAAWGQAALRTPFKLVCREGS